MSVNFKKIIRSILIVCIILSFPLGNVKAELNTEAQGVVLMDDKTGEVLYSKNPNVQFEPASTTKVMTAIVVLENSSLDEIVKVGPNPPNSDGSGIYIEEGQTYTVEEMLHGLLLESANDCAEALAEHVAGSLSEFAMLMNNKAKEIGANNTTFKNPSGLHEEGHLTTAYDLALIMRYALTNKDFVRVSRVLEYNTVSVYKEIVNRNNCYVPWSEYYYQYLYSGKTGWTPEANHTYVAAAIKEDQVLISSYLNAFDKTNQYNNVAEVFNYGFDNFKTVKLLEKGYDFTKENLIQDIDFPLYVSKDIYYTGAIEEVNSLDVTYSVENISLDNLDLKKDQTVLKVKVLVNGKECDEFELLSGISKSYDTVTIVKDSVKSNKLTISIIIIVIIVTLLYIIRVRRKRKLYKKRLLRRKRKLLKK